MTLRRILPLALAWCVLVGCDGQPPPSPPDSPDHLAEDFKRIGDDLLACRRAENERLQRQVTVLDDEIVMTKAEIEALRKLIGETEYHRILSDGGAPRKAAR